MNFDECPKCGAKGDNIIKFSVETIEERPTVVAKATCPKCGENLFIEVEKKEST